MSFRQLATTAGAQYRADAERTGVTSETGPRFFDNQLWERELLGPVAGLVHDRGVLYAGGLGAVYAIHPSTGADFWVFAQPGVQFSPVAIVDDVVYVSGGTTFYALNRATGAALWSVDTGADISAYAPLIANDMAFLGSAEGSVHAIDLATREEVWRRTGESVTAHLTAAKGLVIVPTSTELLALRMKDGAERWSKAGDWSAAATDNKFVYAGTPSGFYALEVNTGKTEWMYQEPSAVPFVGGWSAPVIRNGIVSAGNGNRYVYGLDAGTGARLWMLETDHAPSDAIAGADGLMFFGVATDGAPQQPTLVWNIDIDTGLEWSQRYVYGHVPGGVAIADGAVFVHDSSNKLSAFAQ